MALTMKPFPPPIHLIIPMIPVGVNNYVKHTRSGRHYKTAAAVAFERGAAPFVASSAGMVAKAYAVRIFVYLGKGDRGDIDNFAKQPIDLLVTHRIIHSDAAITMLTMQKQRDPAKPRTEIYVSAVEM